MRDDHGLSYPRTLHFGREKRSRFHMFPVGVDRLESLEWDLRELDLSKIVHAGLGCRHCNLRIAAEDTEVGPQGAADEPNARDIDRVIFEKVKVGMAAGDFASIPETFVDRSSVKLVIAGDKDNWKRRIDIMGQPFDARDNAARQ